MYQVLARVTFCLPFTHQLSSYLQYNLYFQPYRGKSPELGDEWIDPDDGQCDEMKHKRKIKSSKKVQNLNEI